MQPNARRWIHVALAYFCIAVGLGCYMGATHSFTLSPVHAHLNLLGWVTMTLTGVIYHFFPAAASNRLAHVHFWGFNALLPVMATSLTLKLTGNAAVDPVLGLSSVLILTLIVLFAVNVWRNGAGAAVTANPAAAGAGARAA